MRAFSFAEGRNKELVKNDYEPVTGTKLDKKRGIKYF